MKKTNNKGFSLVELIIVIAIMAVLMTVLAPQFLRYVEKTRFQKDASAVGELMNATKVALASEVVAAEITGTTTVTIAPAGTFSISPAATNLQAELEAVIGSNSLNFSSKKYKATAPVGGATYTITISGNNLNVGNLVAPTF